MSTLTPHVKAAVVAAMFESDHENNLYRVAQCQADGEVDIPEFSAFIDEMRWMCRCIAVEAEMDGDPDQFTPQYLADAAYEWRAAEIHRAALVLGLREGDMDEATLAEENALIALRCLADAARRGARCACEVCFGHKGGVPGNENRITTEAGTITMCDFCTAEDMMKERDQ